MSMAVTIILSAMAGAAIGFIACALLSVNRDNAPSAQDFCTHCGASRDEAAMRCTVPGAQHFPCDGEAP